MIDVAGTASGKTGRSAMLLGPTDPTDAKELAIAEPAFTGEDHPAFAEAPDSRDTHPETSASNEILRGILFIGTRAVAQLQSAVEATGATVLDGASVSLKCEMNAQAFFCVVGDQTFDASLKALRETCRTEAASGVVFFGEVDFPDQLSSHDLKKDGQLSGIALGSDHLSVLHQPENANDRCVDLRDLASVCFGEDSPNIGENFPQSVRLRLQSGRLH